LLIVLALLGHDFLMATVAHAAPEAPVFVQHDHALATHAVPSLNTLDDKHPPHPAMCGGTGSAVPYTGPRDVLAHQAMPAMVADLLQGECVGSSVSSWQEPRWPPGTSRALLQVFRV
jgi:hypothetical protein